MPTYYNMPREDNVFEMKCESSFSLIQRLTDKFAQYIEEQKIKVPADLLSSLKGSDPSAKLAFIKMYVSPKQSELATLIQAQITLPEDQLTKCVRYLNAMIEIANA